MMNLIKFPLFVAVMAISLTGCYPGGPEYTDDYDLVGSNYEPEYWAANNPQTYFMPDSLGWILDREEIGNIDTLPREYDSFVLSEVEKNFTALGYTRVDTFDTLNLPDLAVFVQAIAVKNTSVSYVPWYPYWGYGGGYWGGYWPYYGYGYSPVVYSYSTGTVLIEMVDAKNIDIAHKLFNVVWVAGVDGLLRSSSSSNAAFVSESIAQAFKQSPYLKP